MRIAMVVFCAALALAMTLVIAAVSLPFLLGSETSPRVTEALPMCIGIFALSAMMIGIVTYDLYLTRPRNVLLERPVLKKLMLAGHFCVFVGGVGALCLRLLVLLALSR